jgi:hypothetical protein
MITFNFKVALRESYIRVTGDITFILTAIRLNFFIRKDYSNPLNITHIL